MSQFVAILTSDAALVRCELERVKPQVTVGGPEEAIGVGLWQDGQVVQRQYGVGVPPAEAWEAGDSEIILLASRRLGVGENVEQAAQPFRFRQWFFAAAGALEQPQALRRRVLSELPEFLQTSVRSQAWEEAAFACFLAELRALGRMEDPALDARSAAACLGATARTLEQLAASGGGRRPGLALLASNGRVLVAARRGEAPLSWALLEGRPDCPRHERLPDAPDAATLARDHLRRRSVVVATGVTAKEGWQALGDGATLAVDRRLTVDVR